MRKWWGVVIHRRQARRMREETKERQRDIGDIPQRVRERAQHVFPLSHSFRTAECSRALMLARRDVRRYYTLLYRVPRGKGVGRKGIWFISFFNNSLLFSSSLSVAATFWSIALDMSTTIHFYLRSDAGGRWDSSPFPFALFLPNALLFSSWSVQLFAILFPLVEIIAGTCRRRSVCAE